MTDRLDIDRAIREERERPGRASNDVTAGFLSTDERDEAILALLRRGDRVYEWPEDEAEAYREFGWQEGVDAADAIRVRKIVALFAARDSLAVATSGQAIAYLLERRAVLEAPNAAAALLFMARVIRSGETLPESMLGVVYTATVDDFPEPDGAQL